MSTAGGGVQLTRPTVIGTMSIWAAAYAARGGTPTACVCIGDSITAGTGASDSAHKWTTLLATALGGSVTTNVDGHSGQASAFFTTQANYALGSPDPKLVILEVGLNDMSANTVSLGTFKANVLDFISDVRGTLAVDPSFLLLVTYQIGTGYAKPWEWFAQVLYQIAAADADVALLDLRTAFGSPSTAKLDVDLVHPNDTGHALLESTVLAFIT